MSVPDTRDEVVAQLERTVSLLLNHNQELMEMVAVREKLAEQAVERAVLESENVLRLEFLDNMTKVRNGLSQSLVMLKAAKHARGPAQGTALDKLQQQFDELAGLVRTSLDGGHDRPLLSDALEEWIEIRSNLGIDPKKVNTDRNRILDFIAFAGDMPVNKYTFYSFQRFASMLVFLPGNYMKKPELRGKSQTEISDINAKLPSETRQEGLAAKTIDTNYLSPLRMFFRDAAAEHGFRSPLENVDIKISASAKESVERGPLEIEDLNTWFKFAATEKRADNKWLPLLATLTGARIGELICLQGKDIYLMAPKTGDHPGHWVIDLRTEIVTESGFKEKRQLKNRSSRRLIALHNVFEESGFINYAKSREDEHWLFPAAFYHGKERVERPVDAASKRMNGRLAKLKIHKNIEATFHSTRHTAKDFMRLAKVDERTHDKQTGHSLGSV